MPLAIVDCQHDGRTGYVTVISDNQKFANAIMELQSAEPRKAAILKAAQTGLPDPRINGLATPYAADDEGKPVAETNKPINHYRIDIPVTSGR